MSSISLTRILQTKKTSDEADKELFDKQMVRIIYYFNFFL